MTQPQPIGPLMVDVEGQTLSSEDQEIVSHPLVGGIILFSRNFHDRNQLKSLIAQLRSSRNGALLIAVDHEGGRVQRFRDEFTVIPAMRKFGQQYSVDRVAALKAIRDTAALMVFELAECDIDFTFAPVVDIDQGLSGVIGDRALHDTVDGVVDLAWALIEGFDSVGCASVLKHFPGHGSVVEDTHLDFAHDKRGHDAITLSDQLPFEKLCRSATAIMSSHVIYDAIDSLPASLSRVWLTDILRKKLGFGGAIISDDLSMAAVAGLGSASDSTQMALAAGSDLVLICNNRRAVEKTLDELGALPFEYGGVQRRLSLARQVRGNMPDANQLAATRQLLESMA